MDWTRRSGGGMPVNPSTWEVKTGRWEVQGHPKLCSEFESSLGHMRHCLKKKKVSPESRRLSQSWAAYGPRKTLFGLAWLSDLVPWWFLLASTTKKFQRPYVLGEFDDESNFPFVSIIKRRPHPHPSLHTERNSNQQREQRQFMLKHCVLHSHFQPWLGVFIVSGLLNW